MIRVSSFSLHILARCRRVLLIASWLLPATTYAQVNVTTFHNDVARTGQNTLEVGLTTANVNSNQFGKLFTTSVDGYVYAQPLYVSNVSIAAGTHNVIYVATEHDSVYAIDADNGTIYWQVNLIPAGGRTVVGSVDIASGCDDIIPEMGISGTPVIDLISGTLYVVTKATVAGKGIQQLHALDIGTSVEKFGAPVTIQASVPGTAYDSKKGVLTFNPIQELQRPALLLEGGHVIIGWGSDCDVAPWHGWLMSYNATTLAQEAVYNSSPNGTEGGIWMSGGGPVADSSGNIYFSTGNGDWNGTTDLGDSIIKVGPPSGGSFPVLDYFTPWNQAHMYAVDDDLSSSPPLLLPMLPSNQQLLTLMAKLGTIYVVDGNDLGGYCLNQTPACTNSDPQIVQEIPGATTGVWGSPAYWNGSVYWGAQNDALTAFSFNTTTGAISTGPTSKTAVIFGYPAPTPSISSNGSTNGIVWVLNANSFKSSCTTTNTCQILYAYDATNLGHLLYTSSQAANNRDVPGGEIKFATPTVANGKVYVGSQYAVSAFGELNTGTTVAYMPSFMPVAGSYSSAQTVSLRDSITGASIYYTLDGTTPTTGSTLYTGPFTLSTTTTVNAIATAPGYANSPVASATYTINIPLPTVATPGFSPSAGTYYSAQLVTLTDATPGATIYYTLNGGTPTTASTLYTAPFTVSSTTTVSAIAVANGYTNSAVGIGTYVISNGLPTTATPVLTPLAGTYTAVQFVTLTDSTPGSSIYYTLDGSTPTTASTPYTGTLTVSSTTTINAIAVAAGYNNSAVGSATYVIDSSGTAPISVNIAAASKVYAIGTPGTAVTGAGIDGAGDAYAGNLLGNSLTFGGATYILPTAGANTAASNTTIALPAGNYTTLSLLGTGVNGYHLNQVFTVTYTDGSTTSFTQNVSDWALARGYTGESVALATPYRVLSSGATQTGTRNLYAYTFLLNSAKTLQSLTLPVTSNIVVLAVDLSAAVPVVATPTFTPPAGMYTSAQPVTLSDSTSGAAIYYTVDGTTPTTGSTLYTGAFAVSSTTTVNAIAVATGYTNSAVGSATYTINIAPPIVATPTFTPPAGNYTSAQPVSLSDSTSGASIYYTLDGSTPTPASTPYTGAFTVSATTTVNAIAVAAGYTNSLVGSATYTINASGTTPISVSMTPADKLYGIGTAGTPVTGGIDGAGDAYAGNLLGTSLTYGGVTYTFPPAGANTAATNTKISLPAGNYSTLSFLGTGVNGYHLNQVFKVTYTDGTTTSFTQSLSDWAVAQGYSGESVALTMPGYLLKTGVLQTANRNIYAYSFPLNPAKTVQSLTLPLTTNVVVLAVDVSAAATAPVATTPTFTPSAGNYTAAQPVTLTDSTPGAAIYYTLNGSTPTTGSTLYTGAFTVSTTTTVNAIAVAAGYTNSPVGSATYSIGSASGAPISVTLTAADKVFAIGTVGTPVTGGIDGSGDAYAGNLLGTSLTYNGATYTLSAAGPNSAASVTKITLPAGNFTTLSLLGTGVNGNHLNQTFKVTYTDGTTTNFTQSMSDWALGTQGYTGESVALTMPSYVLRTGAAQTANRYLYAYSFPLNSAKTVQSLTLPLTSNVVVLAVDLGMQ